MKLLQASVVLCALLAVVTPKKHHPHLPVDDIGLHQTDLSSDVATQALYKSWQGKHGRAVLSTSTTGFSKA